MSKKNKIVMGSLVLALGANVALAANTPIPDPTPTPSPSPKPLGTQASYSGMLSARYDVSSLPTRFERLQDSVVFGFTVSPMGIVDLVGMLQTGAPYGKRYSTVVDFKDHNKDLISPTLYFKQIYLQKSVQVFDQKITGQLGILASNQKIGTQTLVGPTTAIGTNGWSEGARVSIPSRFGELSVTTGSIFDTKEPEITHRDREMNYLEVQVSRKAFDRLALEASGGTFDGELFVRSAIEYDLQVLSQQVIRLIQEGLYSNEHGSYSATASTDLGKLFNKKLEGRINIDLRYAYHSPDTGFRGQTMNDLVLKGHVVSTALYGKVDRAGRFNWFAARDFNDLNRFQAGMNWKFKGGKK